jgi:dolichol-phosphate mannosyltransferase
MLREEIARTLFASPDYAFDVLFVDDGSLDGSWREICRICAGDSRCRGIRLSRNFGPHAAMTAGIHNADADAVATLACDLQDPPATILEFADRWRRGAQVVWGKRRTRRDSLWRVAASRLLNNLVRRFAMPRHSKFVTGSFLLMDRRVAACYRQLQEHNRVTFALVAWTGFEQDVVEYDRRERAAGTSGWSVGQMFKTMYDTFLAFSELPARLVTLLGVGISLLTVPLVAYVVYYWMIGRTLPGWTGIMCAMAFFFGCQFLILGLVGEYLHRIYSESVHRPVYLVSEETTPPSPGSNA